MTRVYHSVPPAQCQKIVNQIQKEGGIFPAAYRVGNWPIKAFEMQMRLYIDPVQTWPIIQKEWPRGVRKTTKESFIRKMARRMGVTRKQLRAGSHPISARALRSLTQKNIRRLRHLRSRPYSEHTAFGWPDLVAGDLERVFFRAHDWFKWPKRMRTKKGGPSGFVFNAKDLIKMGGRFRKMDLLPHYWKAIGKILYGPNPPKTEKEATRRFLKSLQKIRTRHERRRTPKYRKGYYGFYITELAVPKPVSLKKAIETWRCGKRIAGLGEISLGIHPISALFLAGLAGFSIWGILARS